MYGCACVSCQRQSVWSDIPWEYMHCSGVWEWMGLRQGPKRRSMLTTWTCEKHARNQSIPNSSPASCGTETNDSFLAWRMRHARATPVTCSCSDSCSTSARRLPERVKSLTVVPCARDARHRKIRNVGRHGREECDIAKRSTRHEEAMPKYGTIRWAGCLQQKPATVASHDWRCFHVELNTNRWPVI